MKKRFLVRALCTLMAVLVLPLASLVPLLVGAEDGDSLSLTDIPWESWRMFQSSSDDPNSPYKPSVNCQENGSPLTIGGKVYKNGLRTHPDFSYPAEFVYDISAYDYTTFSATVGKDSVGVKGNAAFEVVCDGKVVAQSPVLGPGEAYKLYADITGCRELILRATDGGDGVNDDSVAWGDPRLSYESIAEETQPGPAVPPVEGEKLFLSDIEWQSWRMYQSSSDNASSPYSPSKDQNELGGTLTIAGIEFEKGLRTHPDPNYPAEFVYDISGYDYNTFYARVGKDSYGGGGHVQFIVLADGEKVAESPLLTQGDNYELACDITGCQILTLQVTDGGDGVAADSAAWGNALLCYDALTDIVPEQVTPTPDDGLEPMEKYAAYLADLATFPISFRYDGRTYRGFSSEHFTENDRKVNKGEKGTATTVTLTHLDSGVTVRVEAVVYPAYNAFEWTVYFTNNTETRTKTFSHIKGANMTFWGDAPAVEGIKGDYEGRYSPYRTELTSAYKDSSLSGRPSHDAFPYYNLEYGTGGVMIAVGWPGTFFANFEPVKTPDGIATVFSAGQQGLTAYLEPGETIRTPLNAFVFYDEQGDAATNAWRDWMIDCNMPTTGEDEALIEPLLSASTSWLYNCMTSATEQSQIDAIKAYLDHGIELDAWWMDAGWYLGRGDAFISALDQSGNWKVDTKRFPTAFKAISDLAAENNMRTILWFEPELFRLSVEEILATNPGFSRDWVLGNLLNNGKLVDMGNPDFRAWLIECVTGILDTGGISVYRQDFNESPGNVWRANDEEGRDGMTENAYCQGYLSYWDAIIAHNPDGFIDNCASGGGRLDLESMRRSVVLHRTDAATSALDYAEVQVMNNSLAQWLVFFGGPTNSYLTETIDLYALRSVFAPAMTLNYNVNSKTEKWALLEALMEEWEVINDYYYADYYELLSGGTQNNEFRAWEYFDEDKNEGFIQVFRSARTKEDTAILKLKGLDPNHTYVLTDFNKTNSITAKGSELMAGYTVTLAEARSAATIFIGSEAIEVPDYEELTKKPEPVDNPDWPKDIPADATYVSDLPIESWIMFGGSSEDARPPYRPSVDSGEHGPLTIGEIVYEKGLRSHISERTNTAELVFDISALDVDRFCAVVGKDIAGESGLIQFQILVDGKQVAESPILAAGETFVLIADISGGKTLTLQATDGGDGYSYDSVGWGNALIYKAASEETMSPDEGTAPPDDGTAVPDTETGAPGTGEQTSGGGAVTTGETDTSGKKSGGCASALALGSLSLSLILAAAAVSLFRKKRC